MKKDTTFSIRISSEDLDTIKRKAKQARMSQSDYVTRCCLGRQVVVIEDLKETAKQLRAIGSNLNQLTVLANMGRVRIANLDSMAREVAGVSAALREIQERGRWPASAPLCGRYRSVGGGVNSDHPLYQLPQGPEPCLHESGDALRNT